LGQSKIGQPGVVADGPVCHGLCGTQPASSRPAAKRYVGCQKNAMTKYILTYLGLNALVPASFFYFKMKENALIVIVPVVTYCGYVYYIGHRAIQDGKSFDVIHREARWFSFAIVYVMGIGGSLLMSLAEGRGYWGLWWGIATGWIVGLFAFLPAMVLVNQFFGERNKPPNQAL
jgi:hypothetical protein